MIGSISDPQINEPNSISINPGLPAINTSKASMQKKFTVSNIQKISKTISDSKLISIEDSEFGEVNSFFTKNIFDEEEFNIDGMSDLASNFGLDETNNSRISVISPYNGKDRSKIDLSELDPHELETPRTSLPDGEEVLKQLKAIRIEEMLTNGSVKTLKKLEQQHNKLLSPPEDQLIVIDSDPDEAQEVHTTQTKPEKKLKTSVRKIAAEDAMPLGQQKKRTDKTKEKKRTDKTEEKKIKDFPPATKKVKIQQNLEAIHPNEQEDQNLEHATKDFPISRIGELPCEKKNGKTQKKKSSKHHAEGE